ncbi:olfactory receptor 51G2-like [Rhinophrynus dorsalis]
MAATGNMSVTFILSGIPELGDSTACLAFLLCLLYLTALLGNCMILYIIHREENLRQPMYYLLSMLAITDIGVSLTTLPTMLSIFWFNYNQITEESCLTQMYFLHTFAAMESGVLVAMAIDRLIAICNPLRYASLLTSTVIAKMGLGILIRGVCVVFPIPFLTRRFPFCKTHVLSHSYCLHQDVIRLACADTIVNSIYGLVAVLMTKGIDSTFIIISYVIILRAVLKIKPNEARLKAFSTCVSHICAVLLFYIPLIGLSVVHRVMKHAPPLLPILMADVYLLVPPVINPVIYSINTRQIRHKIVQVFSQQRIGIADNEIAVFKI